MIRVLQREFDYEVKGTIYVDHNRQFKSFEVRTDSSETFSYGASEWRISFHTHPDKTAQKYGIRYFSLCEYIADEDPATDHMYRSIH